MAEVKNAFIKSKMNKDLDSRLIPSGEYRNALNAQISKSENSDVGALENVLGNLLIQSFGGAVENLSCIGYLIEESLDDVYLFFTDNDAEPNLYNRAGVNSNHFIYKYNTQSLSNPLTLLVEGPFLNFHKNNPIYGVNLLEELLFWTDNRNQPRKINVTLANPNNDINPTYYSNEDQISVAKYNPYKAIDVYKESSLVPGSYESTLKNVTDKFLPNGGVCNNVNNVVLNSNTITITQLNIPTYPNEPVIGSIVKRIDNTGNIVPFTLNGVDVERTITNFNVSTNLLTLNLNVDVPAEAEIVFNPNPYYINDYPGDSSLNQDNFIRFSYRFRFNDGEYSIMAPFTQTCFIPQQDGYFLTQELNKGDEQQAYDSSIVSFMQNKVNEIKLQVPLPVEGSLLSSGFHIAEIDILYSESDSVTVKVIETIPVLDLSSLSSNTYEYVYQSKKPYKTLPSIDTTRVYDKIPVKAFSQEIISNRVVYGNYQNKHTPPASLNYNVSAGSKSSFSLGLGSSTTSSAVDLEPVVPLTGTTGEVKIGSIATFSGSPNTENFVVDIVGNPATSITLNQDVIVSSGETVSFKNSSVDADTTSCVEYPSSSLKTNRNYQVGVVLADKFGRQSTVILSNSKTPVTVSGETYIGSTLYSPYIDDGIESDEWFGNSLKMLFNEGIGPAEPNPNSLEPGVYNGNSGSSSYNPLGWYSYKIVVKQTEQEYYNVYSAGAMKGLPYDYDNDNIGSLSYNNSFVALINDNINKVPRDLSIVGPQDKTFRSSELLYGRVENTVSGNKQFYPSKKAFVTTNIEDLYDMFDVVEFTGPYQSPISITSPLNAFHGFYRSDSNPFIADINTSQNISEQFGVPNSLTSTIVNGTCQGAPSGNIVNVSGVNIGEHILIGSILTSSVLPATNEPYVVTGVEGVAPTLTVTLNKPASVSNGDSLNFTFSSYNDINTLAIFETAPVESKLDIFWETSTSGLVSDLNNLVARSGEAPGATDVTDWNTDPYREDIDVGVNILNSDFTIKDSFGADLDPTTIESISLTVENTTTNPSDVTSYFDLYNPPGSASGYYNIKTTSSHISNVYWGANAGLRNFVFTLVVNITDATPVTIVKQASLANVEPTIGQGESSLSFNALNVSGGVITLAGENGALSTGPNEKREMLWSLLSQQDSSGNDVSQGQPYFQLTGNQGSTNITLYKNILRAPADAYTSVIQLQDGGGTGISESISVTINFLATINSSKYYDVQVDTGRQWDRFEDYECIMFEVTSFNLPGQASGNGWYIYDGTWGELTNNEPSGQVIIDLTGSNKVLNTCTSNSWFYHGTEQGVKDRWEACANMEQGTRNRTTSNLNSSNFVFTIK